MNTINILPFEWSAFDETFTRSGIHIFRLSVNNHLRQLDVYRKTLDSKETLRASAFFRNEDRERFIICRAMLKKILGLYLKMSPKLIQIIPDQNKKPVIKDYRYLHFNVSHSKNCVAFAISNSSVGIDVEYIKENFSYHSIAEGCFTVAEIQYLKESAKPENGFFTLWTRKEALLKTTGKGLNDDMNKINCLNSFPISEIEGPDYSAYTLKSFEIEENYIASVAYNYQGKELQFYKI